MRMVSDFIGASPTAHTIPPIVPIAGWPSLSSFALDGALPCRVFCDRAGILISVRLRMQPKSKSPPCPCKERRDKDGAAARVKCAERKGQPPGIELSVPVDAIAAVVLDVLEVGCLLRSLTVFNPQHAVLLAVCLLAAEVELLVCFFFGILQLVQPASILRSPWWIPLYF